MEDKQIVMHQTSSQFDQLKETYEGKGEDLNKSSIIYTKICMPQTQSFQLSCTLP